ncbi:cytochrome c oxidase subunit II [Sporosarcina sp. P33]|uniref:cytochrome c oxidase subunit II n=1 Tax=Sporosarcina sp. P33 TaxID=1930764 RepID=UPI0009BCB74B|nr:cytochrome c oxidase subunit II [Sporosarcina sp. P33]ARD48656.1 cytochrome C oxidase subunit II [Sporosarcina sp. P33]
MKMHRYEKIWLFLAASMLVIAVVYSGVQTFALGQGPPSGVGMIDPEKVEETAPFDNPGISKIGENEYEVVMILRAFSFEPNAIEIPAGATVHFKMTSTDVMHGFQVIGTNLNAMIMPGHIQEAKQKFTKPGEYLVICNEYCGIGHQLMSMTITVK